MRPKPVECISETPLEVLVERRFRSCFVIVGNELIENAPVARLLDVSCDANNQPMRIVIKSAANIIVPPLGERLVLVVRTAGRQLCCRQVQYPFARTRRN